MHSKTNYWNEIVAHIPHLVIIFGSLLFILYNITISAKKKGWPFFASLAWIIVTPAFIGLLLSLKSPMLSERYLIAVLPFSLIFILGALDVMRLRGQLAILLFLGLLIIGDMAFFFNPQFGKAQWREAASYVSSTVGEDDVIMIEPDYVTPVFRYYFNGPQPVYPLSLKTIKIDSMSDESKALQSINQKHHIVLVSSGQTVETGYARVLMRVALKKDIRVFPLETGITCVKWDIINR